MTTGETLTLSESAQESCAAAALNLKRGEVIGSYQILYEIGHGGMGVVYKVEHIHLKKEYALKVLKCADTVLIARFKIEARVMADMRHENIVSVHQMGVDDRRGICYLVMDYICSGGDPEGGASRHSLADSISEPGQRMSQKQVKSIAIDICSALEYAHSFYGDGIAHRDIKPANVLIDRSGRAYLSDFGIAKIFGTQYFQSISGNTHSLSLLEGKENSEARLLMGTVDFMAPEQRRGGKVTALCDIYAVGILIYRLLTGFMPTGAWRTPDRCGIHCSRRWGRIIRKCLENDPCDRYRSAGALREDLLKIQSDYSHRRTAGVLLAVVILAAAGFWPLSNAVQRRGSVRRGAESLSLRAGTAQLDLGAVQEINGVECSLADGEGDNAAARDAVAADLYVSHDGERWAVVSLQLDRSESKEGRYFAAVRPALSGRFVRLAGTAPQTGEGATICDIRVY